MRNITNNVLSFFLMIFLTNTISAQQKFQPNIKSLRQYKCPEWFRDAKFGIWSCWNAYTVPGQGDWYARNMYLEGSKAYNYHCKTYGHPSKFGYKDIVDLWKGEKFNPEEQIKLFEEAGAKYFVAMANHHDNFDLWDSKYQKWNSVNYGPKRNIIKEWYEATKKSSMRWGITSHLERTWSWFQVNKLSDKKGKYKGIPYDGANPKYEFIYLPPEPTGDISGSQPVNATKWWREYWYNRCEDLIDKYKPDLFYVDGGVPFPGDDKGRTGLKMISHLYNVNSALHKGNNEAVMCLKNWYHIAPKGEWGFYWDGIGTLDFEKGRSSEILDEPWQTDTYLGAWTWLPNIKYRSPESIISELVDVVSKNGNLLVNVTPRPDGTLDDGAIDLLKKISIWMKINSESIYETRPWLIYGIDELRVVKKKNRDDVLYISSLKKPQGKTLLLPFFSSPNGASICSISMLDNKQKLSFTQTKDGILVNIPDNIPGNYVWVFKVEGKKLQNFDVSKYKSIKKRDVKQELSIWQDMSLKDNNKNDLKAIAYDNYATKWAIDENNNLIRLQDGSYNVLNYKAQDIDFSVTGHGAFVDLDGYVYLYNGKDWIKQNGIANARKVSVAENGTIWIADKNMDLWKKNLDDTFVKVPSFKVVELACGKDNTLAIVDNIGRIRFLDNGINTQQAAGVNITDIDYSPKTNHLVAIYNGEIAIYKEDQWLFTGIKAKSVSCGKSNDDEIIGWIEK